MKRNGSPRAETPKRRNVAPSGHDGARNGRAQFKGGLSKANTGSPGGNTTTLTTRTYPPSGRKNRWGRFSTVPSGDGWQQAWEW